MSTPIKEILESELHVMEYEIACIVDQICNYGEVGDLAEELFRLALLLEASQDDSLKHSTLIDLLRRIAYSRTPHGRDALKAFRKELMGE